MKTQITKLTRWICSRLTYNEGCSMVNLLLEIISGNKKGYDFKPEQQSEHYRKFTVDTEQPLQVPADQETPPPTLNWEQLKADHERESGKKLKPVRRRSGLPIPAHCRCEQCNAPTEYLYLNDGKKSNQVRCKICGHLGTTERIRRKSKAKYFCPHCSKPLTLWKTTPAETIYKCMSYSCPHYLQQEKSLTSKERRKRKKQKFDPNYKLHYQYREYHLKNADLKCHRPKLNTNVDLSKIQNSYHVVGLVLTFFVNAGLSSRMTKELLHGIFGIKLSHQTIINYVNAAAAQIAPFLDRDLPKPGKIAAADETYLIVENKWHYTWFVIDAATKAICGYNLSDTRGIIPALATLYNTYGDPGSNSEKQYTLVRDGCPSYDSAMMAYNQGLQNPVIIGQKVIGLENLDKVSTDFRPYKQLVERLNRTYKFHTRPRAGMKSLDGASSLTTLFVAYYNYLRVHGSLKHTPLIRNQLQGIERFPKQWETLLAMSAA